MIMAGDVPLPAFFFYLTTVLLGLCLGSFATALAWRLPRSIPLAKKARSSCPSCGHDLRARDLVPLFSWMTLGGRCRYCRTPVGWRYPLIELATLALCIVFHFTFGFSAVTLCAFALAPALVAMVDIDFRHKILPDVLNITVAAAGFVAIAVAALEAFDAPAHLLTMLGQAVAAALLYGAGSFALRYLFLKATGKEALGLGDVKFFAAAGIWLGLSADSLAAFLLLSGALGVVIALLWKKITREAEFPFGPALIAAFLSVLLWRGLYFVVI
jgi:leader peptidase (prepilin peptidase)/N-methyltransferase